MYVFFLIGECGFDHYFSIVPNLITDYPIAVQQNQVSVRHILSDFAQQPGPQNGRSVFLVCIIHFHPNPPASIYVVNSIIFRIRFKHSPKTMTVIGLHETYRTSDNQKPTFAKRYTHQYASEAIQRCLASAETPLIPNDVHPSISTTTTTTTIDLSKYIHTRPRQYHEAYYDTILSIPIRWPWPWCIFGRRLPGLFR